MRVIRYKTAKLFEASARLGAVIAGAPPSIEEACADYGRSLGTAFQLVDDLLDYEGDPTQLGKNVGDDLREGKPTLPLLMAMERGTERSACWCVKPSKMARSSACATSWRSSVGPALWKPRETLRERKRARRKRACRLANGGAAKRLC